MARELAKHELPAGGTRKVTYTLPDNFVDELDRRAAIQRRSGSGMVAAALPLTTWRDGRRVYPTEVLLDAGVGSLPTASLGLGHRVRTVSAERLSPAFRRLESAKLRAHMEHALALWLDLGEPAFLTRVRRTLPEMPVMVGARTTAKPRRT